MLIEKGASLPFQMKTITVQGHGTASRSPDQIRIEMTLGQRDTEFSNAIANCNQRVAQIKAAAQSARVDEDGIKTANFGVEIESEYDSQARKRFEIGFIARQSVFVVLPWEKQSVGEFLSAIIQCGAEPRIMLTFVVSDAEGLRQEVIANAVENAKRRAEIIASAAGIKLGPIQHIHYGYSEIRVTSEPNELREAFSRNSAASPDIDPDDVESDDTVTITWLIEG